MKRLSTVVVFALVFVLAASGYAGAKTVVLGWDPSPDPLVTGYKLYYDANSSADPLAGTGASLGSSPVDVGMVTTASLSGLADSATYYFKVTAYNASGVESSYSNQVVSLASLPAPNQAPVLASPGNRSVAENNSLSFALAASDPDGDSLSFSATGLPAGATVNSQTGLFQWTPGYDQAGSYTLGFAVSDGSLSASCSIVITVSNSNRAPVLTSPGNRSVAENSALSFSLAANDPDGDSLRYSATGLPPGTSFDSQTGLFQWTPGYDQAGSYTLGFAVSDGSLSASCAIVITVSNSNRTPIISGSPATTAMVGQSYRFAPNASDADGQPLSFSISNRPSWAVFDAASGTLSGTPQEADLGSWANIVISVSDGQQSASLPPFTLQVTADTLDSDGDGVIDSEDAFPFDPTETIDTDLDGIGNNSDPDDDNDGVIDLQDGYPLDALRADWTITTSSDSGGYVIPAGEIQLAFGQSVTITLAPEPGFLLQSLQVDGSTVATGSSYTFASVVAHHTLFAHFVPITTGLSAPPDDPGIPGVRRTDGGSDADNLVVGNPRADLHYRFEAVLRDPVNGPDLQVVLVLDGYALPMQGVSGDLTSGAVYAVETELGPAPEHLFHFEARNASGQVYYSWPEQGELVGPQIYLLAGKNLLGLPGDPQGLATGLLDLLGRNRVVRWESAGASTDLNHGSFVDYLPSEMPTAGHGYLFTATAGELSGEQSWLPEPDVTTLSVPLQTGWNLITNPYSGNVRLSDLSLQINGLAPVSWLTASAARSVVDGFYRYLGDTSGTYAFSSAANNPEAVLTPWVGYWIYLAAEGDCQLVIPRPAR